MPEKLPTPMMNTGRSAWILAAPGAGDNHQLRALGRLIADEVRWFDAFDDVPTVVADRLKPGAELSIPAVKQAAFSPPWPDLVLIAGGRSVIDALRIRHASNNHSRIICIGRPWAPLGWFDLIVTTPQYQLSESESVLSLSLPLNLSGAETDTKQIDVHPEWRDLPRPWLGILLGGDSGSYRFTESAARSIAERINAHIRSAGGSALLISSPRTPETAMDALESKLQQPCAVHRWQANQQPSLLPAVLKHADALYVTSDSASMLAEAIYSGKPVSLLELPQRRRSQLLRRMRSRNLPGKAIKRKLVERGLWLPARDLGLLHDRLRQAGLLLDLDDAARSSGLHHSNQPLQQELNALQQRVDRLFS